MELSDFFTGISLKTLTAVDLPHRGSNQHEINGTAALRQFFQTAEQVKGKLSWFYFADGEEPVSLDSEYTFYDARAKSAARTGRTEWRLYYRGDFLSRAAEEDVLVLARRKDGSVFALVFQQKSSWLQAARVLFGFNSPSGQFQLLPDETLNHQTLEFARQRIIEALGIQIAFPATESDRELVLRKFGNVFPSTEKMSEFARSVTPVNPLDDADLALTEWIQREEELFRSLEDIIVSEKLQTGFTGVDEFITYSLSVQNRRKSRMGFALMHHLAALFKAYGLRFEREAVTERKNKPDFLFPGGREYHDPSFDVSLLVMLGAKSSVKERWRQILSEADKIPSKHLCTLEPGISRAQTDEMAQQRVSLVIPSSLHETYLPEQRAALLTLNEFIQFVSAKQN